ncbi:MAG: glycosyltransferase family 2 protein [Alphaproteobacteria bacterium]|nr:glycosyltransferase family 2 protein [Alphaproteobacteria bacterium]
MIKGLVNLITPAYNSANFIFRLLDSVLSQTYPMIKMYIVDDGSTDNTREVIENYMHSFSNKGYELVYVYQENTGQSYAINNALKMVDGEFLLWPDSDDWYKSPVAIEKLVGALSGFDDEVGVVRCRYDLVSDPDFQVVRTTSFANYGIPEDLLEDAVYERNGFLWPPGGWIIKAKFLDKFIPGRNIYTERYAGQNSQLLFPYFLNSKCVTINDVLYCYWLRESSESRGEGFEQQKERIEAYIRTWLSECDYIAKVADNYKFDEYKKQRLGLYYFCLLKNDIDYKITSSFRHHIKECKSLGVSLPKRYRKLDWWTKLFDLQSYYLIEETSSNLRGLMCRQHN